MHPEYIDYAHHLGIEPTNKNTILDIFEGRSPAPELLPLTGFIGIIPTLEQYGKFNHPYDSQHIVTEDIDYEIVEPFQLPPSNTNQHE